MSKKEKFINEMEKILKDLGAQTRGKKSNKLYVLRKAVHEDLTVDGESKQNFIGFIRAGQAESGPYAGLSLKVNPGINHYRISLDIGSLGFGDDYQLAATPGVKRKFMRLQKDLMNYAKEKSSGNDAANFPLKCFCAVDFTDDSEKQHLKSLEAEYVDDKIDSHTQDLFVVMVEKPNFDVMENKQEWEKEIFWRVFKAVAAVYAEVRNWPNTRAQKKTATDYLEAICLKKDNTIDEITEVKNLLEKRKYVVLQGAPGTGKTRLTGKLRSDFSDYVFTQFHAETSYSDFIGGYQPSVLGDNVVYRYENGPLLQAIKKAQEKSNEKVLLIIDEINRANLSNVLGEAFYLFEKSDEDTRAEISLGKQTDGQPEFRIKQLPENLYVVATMNTSDRSLAVVDFALRRRFMWYTLFPQSLPNNTFHLEQFNKINEIFEMYASSEELLLQPGQSYFIADSEEEMKERIEYELLPLIKEYLNLGFLTNAADHFNQFFIEEIDQTIDL